MRLINCGVSGTSRGNSQVTWQELDLDPQWLEVINVLSPNSQPRLVQSQALGEQGILESRCNLIISAPTNSGKSLLGTLLLLDSVRRQRRAILLEPLRVLAREKADELKRMVESLSDILGVKITVKISTGDYRLEDESLADAPPGGEIIVATPERLESIIRNPKNDRWLANIGAVCVDEAHLLADSRRGTNLEYLITSLLCFVNPPRLALLSATLGKVDKLEQWLSPCEVVKVTQRQPPLHKWVMEIGEEEEANTVAIDWIKEQLQIPDTQVLVFVYQKKSTDKLVSEINKELADLVGAKGASAYHSQMSQAQREQVYQSFLSGESKVVVATTALSMGINLPTTHVLVRDTTFFGYGKLEISDLLQMIGRAGRGNLEGTGLVLVRPNDDWGTEELKTALQNETLPEFRSAFERESENNFANPELPLGTVQVASLLSRSPKQGKTIEDIKTFLDRSLGGKTLASQVPCALNWLEANTLAFQDPESSSYKLTVLGKRATLAVLPLPLAASYVQLIRDLMTIDPQDELLKQWKALDHLLVLDLLVEKSPSLRRYSAKLAEQIEGWSEKHSDVVPLLFREWIRGKVGYSRAPEIMGSLGIKSTHTGKKYDKWACETGYLSVFRTIILYERSRGVKATELERKYKIKDLEGIEEKWRDNLLWLLSGLSKLLEIRTFYYHLKEDCQADRERIWRVKKILQRMHYQTLELREDLKYCSPLGSLLREIRRSSSKAKVKVGIQSIRRLEKAGIDSLKDLVKLQVDDLIELGIRRGLATQIRGYVKRRMQ